MITLDTSAILAALNVADPDHRSVRRIMESDTGPYIVPICLLGELAYLVEQRLPPVALFALIADLESGVFIRDDGQPDMPRVRHLVERYVDLPLGFVDAAVIACAERHGGRVLTLDLRHFGVVAREGTITLPLLA